MKYVYQFAVILSVTIIADILYYVLPFPIPASIYGLIIMLFCLCTKIVKLNQVSEAGDFLLKIMPVMFIPASVGLIDIWHDLVTVIIPILVITILTTLIVIVVTGKVTEAILDWKRGDADE